MMEKVVQVELTNMAILIECTSLMHQSSFAHINKISPLFSFHLHYSCLLFVLCCSGRIGTVQMDRKERMSVRVYNQSHKM